MQSVLDTYLQVEKVQELQVRGGPHNHKKAVCSDFKTTWLSTLPLAGSWLSTLPLAGSINARSHTRCEPSCPITPSDIPIDLLDCPPLLSDSEDSLYSSSGDSVGADSRRAYRLAAAAAVRFAQRPLQVRAAIHKCAETPTPSPLLQAAIPSPPPQDGTLPMRVADSSSDSDAPVSRAAVRLAIAAARENAAAAAQLLQSSLPIKKKRVITIDDRTPTPTPPPHSTVIAPALQVITIDDRTPTPTPRPHSTVIAPAVQAIAPTQQVVIHEHGGSIDPLNLWKAVPNYHHQFLDLHAKHASDDDSFMSSSDDDNLSAGFISDRDDALNGPTIGNAAEMEFLARQLPVTLQRIKNVRKKRQQKQANKPN